MPLDEPTRHLALLLEPDLERMMERERARDECGETVRYDSVSRMATWQSRRGEVVGRWYGEVLATWLVRDRILRWTWATDESIASVFGSVARSTHAEVISREGRLRGVPQLAMSVVGDLDEDDVVTLVRVGVIVAQGVGIEIRRRGDEVEFIGLFDSPRPIEQDSAQGRDAPSADVTRDSGPPPLVSSPAGTRTRSPSPSPPRVASYGSLPPIREIYGPPSRRRSTSPGERPIREPSRALFLPVATLLLRHVARVALGYQQALFVLTVEERTLGIGVQLVALDASGTLRAIDPPEDLVEAARRMVHADRDDGNGPWRRLSARILPKADGGATLSVDVV